MVRAGGNRKSPIQNRKWIGGEDRNRTYPATCAATTVLKTARATRHPSLSEFSIFDCRLSTIRVQCEYGVLLCFLDRSDDLVEIRPVARVEFGMEEFAIGPNLESAAARWDQRE